MSRILQKRIASIHLGLQNDSRSFINNEVALTPKPGKLAEVRNSLAEIRSMPKQRASLSEITKLTGQLIFLLMSCFNNMARGGLQPFFQWLAENIAYTQHPSNRLGSSKKRFADRTSWPSLAAKHKITAGLALGM